MSTFSDVQDMTNPTLVLESLQKVGDYFHQCQAAAPEAPSLSGLLLPDEAYKSAMGVFHPLANYLQNKADDSQKEELSEMLTNNSKIVDHLCEGLLYPYVKGIIVFQSLARVALGVVLAAIFVLKMCRLI